MSDLATLSRTIYANAPGAIKYKLSLRPYICPFHRLIGYVPCGATILDVGCGAGLFILLLARLDRVESAVGFDANRAAIRAARDIAAQLPNSEKFRFEHCNASESWPEGRFDVVCLIDVLHHVPQNRQAAVFATAIEHVAEGGILLYKDMASRPRWRAWANRLHDLVSAGEWIHYVNLNDTIAWAQKNGLHLDERGAINMFWYRHEWCVFRRSPRHTQD